MNRNFTAPVSAASDCPVLWRELIPLFKRVFPNVIRDAIDNDIRARVNFLGTPFDIIPEGSSIPEGSGIEPDFSVWGPPHINHFPDSV